MNVLFDSQAFDMQTHGGVSRCFAELYAHMPSRIKIQIPIIETENVYLQQYGFKRPGDTYREYMGKHTSSWYRMRYKIHYQFMYGQYSQWDRTPNLNRLEQEQKFKEKNFDIFHPTFFDSYFLPHIGDKPFVITVHDMIPEIYTQYYPEDERQKQWKKQVIPRATHLVAVSENTKKDIIRLMGIPEEKISVIYHGAETAPYTPSPKRPYDFEYILYVGDRHMYKNFIYLSREFIPILKRHKELKVICTGKPFTQEEKYFFEAFGMEGRFVQTFVESDQELMDLYHYAIAFVYPSEYEGFGIPILEAYKTDCPIMLNSASCFPEIAGDAAIYFKLNKEESNFEEQFETLYHLNSNEKEILLDKQRNRLKRYSWDKSAQQLANVYERLT